MASTSVTNYENYLPDYPRISSSPTTTSTLNSSPTPPSVFVPLLSIQFPGCQGIGDTQFSNFNENQIVFLAKGSLFTIHDITSGQCLQTFKVGWPSCESSNSSYSEATSLWTRENHDEAYTLGAYNDLTAPLLLVGTTNGHIALYDAREEAGSRPSLILRHAHNGPISGLHGGIPFNSSYIFSTGKTDGWIREFDLRYPFHHNMPSKRASPLQSISLKAERGNSKDKADSFHHLLLSNGCGLEGIPSMDISRDGSSMVVSSNDGECVLFSLSDFPIRSMKRWLLGDFSIFHDVKFTLNSKYVVCCSQNKAQNNFAAHLWNVIESNRQICLKTPGDGAAIYQGHFLLADPEEIFFEHSSTSSYRGENSNVSGVDISQNDSSTTLNEPYISSDEKMKELSQSFDPCLSDARASTYKIKSKQESSERHKLILHTPESDLLHKLHREFWNEADAKLKVASRSGNLCQYDAKIAFRSNTAEDVSVSPKLLFPDLPAQHAAFYINSGVLHPSYGRTDLFNSKFVCTPWREFVVGVGGNRLYKGIHQWDTETGVCLSSAVFHEAAPMFVQNICAHRDYSKGLIATAGTQGKHGIATIWKCTPLEWLTDSALQGSINLLINPDQ